MNYSSPQVVPSHPTPIHRSLFRTRFGTPTLLLALVVLGISASHAAVQHVIQISVDGLRGDRLKALVDAAPESFPNFVRLQTEGAYTYNARCDYDYSVTVPNHATMLTGRPVAQPEGQPDTTHHDYTTNFPIPGDTLHNAGNPNLDYIASVFDVAHDHGLATAYYVGKTRLEYLYTSYSTAGGPDLTGEDNGSNKIDFSIVQNGGTQNLIDAIVSDIATASVHYTFLHITDPDTAGHAAGWLSLNWDDAVLATDTFVGEILAAIDNNPAMDGRIAITLTGDHGGGGGTPNNHTDATFPENYLIPFFIWGPGVQPGSDLYTQFMNRTDPGLNRPDYIADGQPIRDGDAPNLSMALLGLPPVPGSFMLPVINFSGVSLQFSHDGESLNLSWPDSGPDLVLEWTSDFSGSPWQRFDSGIINNGTPRNRTLELGQSPSAFYRLRTPKISISQHPQPVTVHTGANVVFSVLADAPGGMTYQWRRDEVDIPGATGSEISVENVTGADSAGFSVLVSYDTDLLLSETAALTVLLNPVITLQPVSQSVSVGDNVVFTVAGFGANPLTYQWHFNGVDLDATSDTLTIENAQSENDGEYTVTLSDGVGETTSAAAFLSIPAAPVIIQQPLGVTATVGDTVNFTVVITGSPPPFTYRWRRIVLLVDLQESNLRTSTFSITNVQLSDAGNFNVVVSNPAFPSPGVRSDNALLTVIEP